MATATTDARLAPLLAWFAAEGRALPWRATRDRWSILVAETMLAQTQVDRVVAYWTRFVAEWPTPAAMASARLADMLVAWQGLGYPRRARDLHRAATAIAAAGRWPDDPRELPGVGPYTAAALRCFADGEPVVPVDVNVRRVLARRFGGEAPDVAPADGWAAGQALMELGQRVCRARRPDCEACPLAPGCAGPEPTSADDAAPVRRQPRFEGSFRQLRGRVLARVLAAPAEVGVVVGTLDDAEAGAAASLVDDGLLARDGDRLRAC